jgi:hypothetical protein
MVVGSTVGMGLVGGWKVGRGLEGVGIHGQQTEAATSRYDLEGVALD